MTKKTNVPTWVWRANGIAWAVVWVFSGFNLIPGIPLL